MVVLAAALTGLLLPLAGAPLHLPSRSGLQIAAPAASLPAGPVRTLPVRFIANAGQLDPAVRFYVQASGKTVYFTPGGVTYALTTPGDPGDKRDDGAFGSGRWAVKASFIGAGPSPVIEGLDRQRGVVSYFSGKPSEWKTGLAAYGAIVYRDVWPGIDLEFDARVNQIKYKFVVRPGADPSQIRLAYSGAGIGISPLGELAISTPFGALHDAAPFAYQERGGARLPIASSYRIDSATERSGAYGFLLGAYDHAATLVIDPSVTVYAGYIGGVDVDAANAVAVDEAGNAYVAGETASAADFPTAAGPDTSFNGGNRDAFVAKISADGSSLLYAGFLGGAGDDYATGIAIDASGNAYVTGGTRSNESSFPVVGGPDLSFNGASDAFVAKINAAGTALVYSGYIGGAEIDTGNAIAIDDAGNAYIAGDTFSPEATFPVTVGPDLTFNGVRDAFVAKVNPSGSALSYAGYIGGAQFDIARAIAVDSAGSAYVAGETASDETSFPVRGGPDLTYNGGSRDAFVAQVAPGGGSLSYAGYIGGAGDDIAHAIAVNAGGEAFVAGETASTEASFPVLRGPALTYGGGSRDAFAAKVNAGGGSLFYSGFIGGAGTDIARAAALDDAGNLVVAGSTTSAEDSFPVVIGPGTTFGGVRDAFTSKVNPAGTGLLFSGYFGGEGDDSANGVALDAAGNVYLAGASSSSEVTFPVAVGPDLTANGSTDGFVAKLNVGEPHITAEGVVNAASYRGGAIAPGEIISIFGTAIGPDEPLLAQLDEQGRVAATLGNTTVYFGSDPGALFYVSDTQINVQAPYSIDGASTVEIRITHDGFETNTITVPVAPSAPGIFSSDASGSGQAAAVDVNGNLNTAGNPVGPGDVIVIFATGEGQTVPPGVTGKLAVEPFPKPVLPVKLLIGGIEAQLLYAGAAPGFAGLLQVNAIVPDGIFGNPAALKAAEGGTSRVAQSGGGIPVELIIGDKSSQPDIFLNFGGGTGVGIPTAGAQSLSTNEDTPLNITLTASDPTSQPLAFSIASQPAHGALSAFSAVTPSSASLVYTPNLNFNGPDSFQFQVIDPDGNTASATVSINVLPVNDPPKAVDDSANTNPGESVTIHVLSNDSDPDGDPLTVVSVGTPSNGTASTNGTTVTYTPASGFTGTDTFSYTISDGELTDSATIRVTVGGSTNESPSGAGQTLTTNQGVPILITLTGSDPNGGDVLSYSIQSGPSNGTLSAITKINNNAATVTYTPNPSFIGSDTFTYRVSDQKGAYGPGIIVIQVKPVADLGIVKTDSPDPVLAGAMLTYNLAVSNAGPNDAPGVVVTDTMPAFVTLVSVTPTLGSCTGAAVVSCNLGTLPNGAGAAVVIVVTVNPGFRSGSLQNTATVAGDFADLNPGNNSSTALTTIINEPPVIGNPSVGVETVGNTQLKVARAQAPQIVPEVFFESDLTTLANVTDINGDPLTFSLPSATTANGGKVTIINPSTGEFVYVPVAANNNPDSFTYQVADPSNPAVMGTVNITFSGRIWYVKNDALTDANPDNNGNDGTSANPFAVLLDTRSVELPGDDIFVHFGDGTTTGQDSGIRLANNQRLIGEGVALDIDVALNGGSAPTPLFPAGTHPLIDNTNASSDGVTADNVTGIEVRGVNAQGTSNGIWITCNTGAVTAVVSDNIVRSAGEVGLGVVPHGTCALTATVENNKITAALAGLNGTAYDTSSLDVAFNRNAVTVNDSPTSVPIAVNAPGGTGSATVRSFDGNTVSGSSGGMSGGIFFENVTFDANPSTSTTFEPVPGGATVIGDTAGPDPFNGPGMVLNNVSGNLEFTSLDIEAENGLGAGLGVSGAGAFMSGPPDSGFRLAIGGGVIHTTSLSALSLDLLTADITLDNLTSENSTSIGVSLSNVAGAITINNGGSGSSISGSPGGEFFVSGGDAVISYGGSITAGTGRAVDIQNRTGGSVTFGGPVTSDGPGRGISITGASAANTVNFNGAVNLGQTTFLTTTGLAVTGNHADTEVHFNAALNITTASANGIVGSAGGMLTTTSGAINTTNATALDIADLDFGPSSLNFDTIIAYGWDYGIDLRNFTGTAHLGVVTLETSQSLPDSMALNLVNGGTVTTLPGSTINATNGGRAINADNVDFGFGSLHFNSIKASSATAPVTFTNTSGRANLMGGTIAASADNGVAVNLDSGTHHFELIVSGTSLGGIVNSLAASTGANNDLCLSAAGNTSSGNFLLSQSGISFLSVLQQDSATLSALNGGVTVSESGTVNYGTGCLSAPVPGDPFGTPPTAVNDNAGTILEGGTVDLNVVVNDTDPDPGDGLFLNAIVTPPTLGSAMILSPTTVRYTQNVTIGADAMDSFVYQIVDKSGNTSTATVVVSITNVNDPPMIANSTVTYEALGNTALEVVEGGTQSPPSLFLDQAADSLIGKANITDTDGPGPFSCSLTGTPPSGMVTFLPNSCNFTYMPPAGNRGDGTATPEDTFQYIVSDNSSPTPGTAMGTVNINIAGLVWYVKNDYNSGTPNTGTGTSSDPFTTLADVDGTSDGPGGAGPSEVGDIIYVFRGDGTATNQDAGISLRNQQKLRGSGAPLVATGTFNGVVNPTLLPVDASGPPLITNASGAAVLVDTAADGGGNKIDIEIVGLSLTGVNPINVACSGTFNTAVTAATNTLSGTGNGFNAVSQATCGTTTIALNSTVAGSSAGSAVFIDGSLDPGGLFVRQFSGNSVPAAAAGNGIVVRGAIFDADPSTAIFNAVSGGNTVVAASGMPVAGFGMQLGDPASASTRVSGELVFTDLDIFATGTALSVAGGGVLTPASPNATSGFGLTTPAGSTLSSASGAALLMDPLTASTVFDTANGTIVSLTDVAGVVNIAGGALAGTAGTSTFKVDGGNAAVTYGGSATAGSGQRVVDILNRTGGSATFGGAITSNSPGQGISIVGATGASNTTFNGNVDLGVTTALGSAGVNINHNATASTTSFANLDIVTSGATGLSASNGGTLGITTGTVGATGGTAVNISGTNTSSFTLASVTQSGAAAGNAINIANSTGAKNFTAASIANTSGIGIALSSAGTVNIDGGSPTSSITTTSGQALSVANTAMGMNFASVSSNGGTNNISLNTATGSFIANGGALSGATGDAVNISGGSGTFTYAGTIGKSGNGTGQSVDISNHGAGATTFSGAITDTADGILLSTNTGTFAFNGGVSITNTGEAGFTATSSGTVTVDSTSVSTTVTTTSAPAVVVAGTTTNMTFDSLSSTNSTTHGVDLTNLGAGSVFNGGTTTITNAANSGTTADGALRIATVGSGANIDFGTTNINTRHGTGVFIDAVSATAMSPSTIDFGTTTIPNPNNAAGYGIRIQGSGADVTIGSATISGTVIGTVTTYDATGRPTNDGDGDGIFLKNNTGEFSFTLNGGTFTTIADNAVDYRTTNNVTLNGITIGTAAGNGAKNAGIRGDIGTNLTVQNSNFAHIGDGVSPGTLQGDNGMTLRDIAGTFTIQNSTLDGSDGYTSFHNGADGIPNRAVELDNRNVNLNVNVTGSTVRFWDFQGLNLRFIGGTMNIDVGDNTVGNANTFTNINGAAINSGPSMGAATNTHSTDVLRNTFTNVGIAVEAFSSRGGDSTVRIVNNTVATTISDAFRLVAFANGAVGALPNYNARVTGNTVTGLAGGDQGNGGGAGFFVAVEDGSSAQVLIDNNIVTGHNQLGSSFNTDGMLTTQHQRGGNMDIKFSNNDATNLQNNAFGAIYSQVNGTTGANSQCINFSGDTYTNVKPGTFGFDNIYSFDLTAVGGDDNIELQGFVDPSPPATEAEVAAFLNGVESTAIAAADVTFFGDPPIAGMCLQANVPPAP